MTKGRCRWTAWRWMGRRQLGTYLQWRAGGVDGWAMEGQRHTADMAEDVFGWRRADTRARLRPCRLAHCDHGVARTADDVRAAHSHARHLDRRPYHFGQFVRVAFHERVRD